MGGMAAASHDIGCSKQGCLRQTRGISQRPAGLGLARISPICDWRGTGYDLPPADGVVSFYLNIFLLSRLPIRSCRPIQNAHVSFDW